MQSKGFKRSLSDSCLYTKFNGKSIILALIWVDDIVICATDNSDLNNFKNELSRRFKMKDLGVLSWFLGIKFDFSDDTIKMSQSDFIYRFNMNDAKPRSLPSDVHVNKFNFELSPILDDATLYRQIIGSLIYIMTCTRPDLAFIVTKLSQYMNKPTFAHLAIAKNVLRYLKGTANHSLIFRRSDEPLKLFGFCDSDWGGSDDRRSISGYCFKLCQNGPLISWNTRKQSVVSLSSCEAEYTALTHGVQEGKFLSQLLSDVSNSERVMFTMYVDNQGAIKLANNPVHHQRSKHIDIKYHFIRFEIQNQVVKLVYIPTDQNVADIFTKPLSKANLSRFNISGT